MKKIYYFSLFLLPTLASAQALSTAGSTIHDVIWEVIDLIELLVPILVTFAFLVFFWGLSRFILHSGSQSEIQKGKQYMFWGVIALFVLITFQTIVFLISGEFFGGNGTLPLLPQGTSVGT